MSCAVRSTVVRERRAGAGKEAEYRGVLGAQITSNTYYQWLFERAYLVTPAQAYVRNFLETFKEYPQRQKAASFNLDDVVKQLEKPGGS